MQSRKKEMYKHCGFVVFYIDSPRKEPFPEIHEKPSSGCWCFASQPTVVNVVAFLRSNSWSVKCLSALSVRPSVCLCTTLYPLWVLGVGMAGSRGVIRTNCLCRAASQSALTPLSVPVLGRHSHLLALLCKPEQPVTQGFGWTGDVPYL